MRFPNVLHEDAYITPRLFYKSRSVAVSEKHGYMYIQRQGSIMHRSTDLARLSVLDILDDRVKLFKSWGYEKLAIEALNNYFGYLLGWYKKLKQNNYKKELDKKNKYQENISLYDMPKEIKNASMKDIHTDDNS